MSTGTASAAAQATPDPEQPKQEEIVDQDAVVAPETVVEETKADVPELAEEIQTQTATNPAADPAEVVVPGNAAFQTPKAKQQELTLDCQRQRTKLPTSRMLGFGGTVASDDDPTWGVLLLAVAAGAGLFVAVAVVRRWRAPAGARKSEDRLERLATLVAIVGGVVGLVVTFVPGVAANERPAQEATMNVREVHPRITRNEYALRTGASRKGIDKIDRREVGNVIWLEIVLRGYAGKHPVLQYGLYDQKREVLLPNTAKPVPLRVEDADEQTSFQSVWVGYPSGKRFQAQFRLLEDGRVRQMAKTGGMSGSTVRYACPDR